MSIQPRQSALRRRAGLIENGLGDWACRSEFSVLQRPVLVRSAGNEHVCVVP